MDPMHKRCEALRAGASVKGLDVAHVNDWLHDPESHDPWPAFLITFTSNGCGDYYAYDTRQAGKIHYIDPDLTVDENLASSDPLTFESFEAWYRWKVGNQAMSGIERLR